MEWPNPPVQTWEIVRNLEATPVLMGKKHEIKEPAAAKAMHNLRENEE